MTLMSVVCPPTCAGGAGQHAEEGVARVVCMLPSEHLDFVVTMPRLDLALFIFMFASCQSTKYSIIQLPNECLPACAEVALLHPVRVYVWLYLREVGVVADECDRFFVLVALPAVFLLAVQMGVVAPTLSPKGRVCNPAHDLNFVKAKSGCRFWGE